MGWLPRVPMNSIIIKANPFFYFISLNEEKGEKRIIGMIETPSTTPVHDLCRVCH